jgi:hypothetical protein
VLERSAGAGSKERAPWHVRNACGLAAAGLGFIALVAAFVMQFGGKRDIDQLPDMRVTIPLFTLVLAAAVAALFVRRETTRALPVAGLGMAGAALALGWVIVACAVAIAAIIVIAIISKFT